jgi:hypothetical protein
MKPVNPFLICKKIVLLAKTIGLNQLTSAIFLFKNNAEKKKRN